MNQIEIEKQLITIINKFLKLRLEYPLPSDLSLIEIIRYSGTDTKDLDSIDVVEIIIQVEEKFGVIIDDSAIKDLQRWASLINYIHDNQKK
jgi:acyl carrier protein